MAEVPNPILPGCHPDPSIVRVGPEYYLANSTFEWWPGVQLHHSRDLVNWRLAGHALTRESQLNLRGIVDSGGVLITRDLSNAILPGVTRRVMLDAAAEAQIKIQERKFTVAEAQAAKEAFLSSATGAAVPVVTIDGKSVGDGRPGPLTERIRGLYAARAGQKKA